MLRVLSLFSPGALVLVSALAPGELLGCFK
jgi:hypothetical protein